MLLQMLELLRAGGVKRVEDLARALETTPEMIEAMLEELARMGYLKRVGGECRADTCPSCPMAGACAAGAGSRLWTLTERGQRGGP